MVSIGSFASRKSFQSKNMKLSLYKPLATRTVKELNSLAEPLCKRISCGRQIVVGILNDGNDTNLN